jgi:hypothetical protein
LVQSVIDTGPSAVLSFPLPLSPPPEQAAAASATPAPSATNAAPRIFLIIVEFPWSSSTGWADSCHPRVSSRGSACVNRCR